MSFTGEKGSRRKKQELRTHHVISMVYTVIDQALDHKSLSYCKSKNVESSHFESYV